MDLDQLRDKSGRSRQDLGKVWSDITEYEAQKSRVEESSRGHPHWETEKETGSSKRSQSKQWEGSPKQRSKSRTHSQSKDAHTGSDEGWDPGAGGDDSSTQWSVHPKGLPPHLEWIPWVGSDFPAHLSLSDKPAFTVWAESYPYETESQVKALSFLPDYVHVATKVIAKVLWAMVYVLKGGSLPCPNSLAQELQWMDPVFHQPPDSAHPVKITFHEDLHSQAWESWEEILSWVQY